jgi:quinol-cytochrome oxidoreductase complex cytochrome b subunit
MRGAAQSHPHLPVGFLHNFFFFIELFTGLILMIYHSVPKEAYQSIWMESNVTRQPAAGPTGWVRRR